MTIVWTGRLGRMPHMKSNAKTVAEYLDTLPDDRREAIEAVISVINKNLNKGFEQGMQYGMPAWFVPHSVYPDGYHCDPSQPLPFASIASQKNHMSFYMCGLYYSDEEMERFQTAWKKTGKRLDMGKSCIRFKKLENLPVEVIGKVAAAQSVDDFILAFDRARKR